jgi:hypothetical protein
MARFSKTNVLHFERHPMARAFLVVLVLLASISFAVAQPSVWIGSQDGAWGDRGNWDSGVVPNGAGQVAVFGPEGFSSASEVRKIDVADTFTIGQLRFPRLLELADQATGGQPPTYRLEGAGTLIFDTGSVVESGILDISTDRTDPDLTIAVGIRLASPLKVTVANYFRRAVISGSIGGQGGAPANMSIVGNIGYSILSLAGDNDFAGGAITLTGANLLELDSPNAARGATIRIEDTGEGPSERTPIADHVSDPNPAIGDLHGNPGLRISVRSPAQTSFNFNALKVDADGGIYIQRPPVKPDERFADSLQGDTMRIPPSQGVVTFPSILIAEK